MGYPDSVDDSQDLLERLRKLEKVSVDGVALEDVKIKLFGNNFHLLFMLLLFKDRFPFDRFGRSESLEAEEAWGEKWHQFIAENQDLLEQMRIVFEDYFVYKDLMENFRGLIDGIGIFEQINKELGPLSADAVKIPIYRKLNPLLKQAFDGLKKYGLDPERFCQFV